MAREVNGHSTRNRCPHMIMQVVSIGSMLLAKKLLLGSRRESQRVAQFSNQFLRGYRNSHPTNEAYDTRYQEKYMKPNTWAKNQETLRKRDKRSRNVRISPPQQFYQQISLSNSATSTTSRIYLTDNLSLTGQALPYIPRMRGVQLEEG